MYQRILIGYDGSREAERALVEGVSLAKALGSHVTLATISEPMPSYLELAVVVEPQASDEFRKDQLKRLGLLQVKASELAKAHGLTIETTLVESTEVAGILEAANTLKSDLLVLHDQHVEWVGTVRQIANKASCSILAVV